MKKILTLMAISVGLFASQAFAIPVFINIDDFNSGVQSISDTTPGNGPVTAANGIRTISSNMLTAVAPVGNTVDVTGVNPGGFLDITNGGSDDSEVIVSWALAGGLLPTGATNIGFFFNILESDGNPTNVDFYLNSVLLSSSAIPPNALNQNVSFSLTPAQVLLANAGGALSVNLNGAPGWDLSADAFGFSYEPAVTHVPEPATLGLIGLGLVGLGLLKKRKQA